MNRHHAFTLIELLTVISIIAVLAAMLLPAIGMVRDSAQSSLCASALRQIGMGCAAFGQEHEDCIPDSYTGVAGLCWNQSIDPYFEGAGTSLMDTSKIMWEGRRGTGVIRSVPI